MSLKLLTINESDDIHHVILLCFLLQNAECDMSRTIMVVGSLRGWTRSSLCVSVCVCERKNMQMKGLLKLTV